METTRNDEGRLALEVLVCFDGAVIGAAELRPGATFSVGAGTEFPLPEGTLAQPSFGWRQGALCSSPRRLASGFALSARKVEEVVEVADRGELVAWWGGSAACLVVRAYRGGGVEAVVSGSERRQAVESFDEFEDRGVVGGAARDDRPFACVGRNDPQRYAHAEPVCVDLRWRDVVEEAAVLVVGQEVRRLAPERGVAKRGDELLLKAHPDRDVCRGVFVEVHRVARYQP